MDTGSLFLILHRKSKRINSKEMNPNQIPFVINPQVTLVVSYQQGSYVCPIHNTTIHGDNLTIVGNNNHVFGSGNKCFGFNNTCYEPVPFKDHIQAPTRSQQYHCCRLSYWFPPHSVIEGDENAIYGDYLIVRGNNNTVYGRHNRCIGIGNLNWRLSTGWPYDDQDMSDDSSSHNYDFSDSDDDNDDEDCDDGCDDE